MKYLINIFLKAFFIISIINCSAIDPIELDENIFREATLEESTTEFLFPIPSPRTQTMLVEIIMSHPSKYTVTFNQYDIEEQELLKSSQSNKETLQVEDPKNSNIFYLNGDIEERFIHPKRRLASDFSENQTNLIEKEEIALGKNKVFLNLDENMKKIILSVFKSDEGDDQVGKIYIKYIITPNIEEEKYTLKDTKIDFKQDKDMFNITFSGVQQSNMNLKDFTVLYNIKLYDSETLYSNYENIYYYAINDKVTPLFSTIIRLKGDATKEDNHLKIKAPLNNKATQLLLVNAHAKNGDENEQLLQYEVSDFKVEEESEERVWPEEKEEEKEKEKEKEKENEKEEEKEKEKENEKEEEKEKEKEKENEKKEKEKSDEEKYEENRNSNKTTLIIIMCSFGGSIIITFIGVFIYLLFFAKKDTNIEEEQDYKNVGGIVKNDDKDKENKNMNTDEGNINEEEE